MKCKVKIDEKSSKTSERIERKCKVKIGRLKMPPPHQNGNENIAG